jgi:hypothetical protein
MSTATPSIGSFLTKRSQPTFAHSYRHNTLSHNDRNANVLSIIIGFVWQNSCFTRTSSLVAADGERDLRIRPMSSAGRDAPPRVHWPAFRRTLSLVGRAGPARRAGCRIRLSFLLSTFGMRRLVAALSSARIPGPSPSPRPLGERIEVRGFPIPISHFPLTIIHLRSPSPIVLLPWHADPTTTARPNPARLSVPDKMYYPVTPPAPVGKAAGASARSAQLTETEKRSKLLS